MRKIKFVVWCLIALATLRLSANTLHTNIVDGVMWVYTIKDGGASLGGGSVEISALPKGGKGDVIVPSSFRDYAGEFPVTDIAYAAFAHQTGMTSIIVPKCVNTISHSAFMGCCSLTNMVLPFVGNARTAVGTSYAAGHCWSHELFGYIFGSGNVDGMVAVGQWCHVGTYGSNFWTTYYLPPSLESVTITDEEYFCSGVFSGLWLLKSIGIPSCLKGVGSDVVWYCSNLRDFHIQDISGWCSYGGRFRVERGSPRNLYLNGELIRDLEITGDVTDITYGAFADCTNITSITVPPTIDIKGNAFAGCSSLTNMIMPCSFGLVFDVFAIGYEDYPPKDGIVSIIQQNYPANWGAYTRYIPAKIKSVNLSNVSTIKYGEFHNCSMIEEIYVGGMATNVQEWAFNNCSGLKRLVFGGDAPVFAGSSIFDGVNSDCKVFVRRSSTGWGVDIPGTWRGFKIDYYDYEDIVIEGVLPHATDELAYTTKLVASGGTPPYAWSMESINGVTITKDGVLSIPALERGITTSQQLNVMVTVSDLKGVTKTQTIAIIIDPYPNQRPIIDSQSPSIYSIGAIRIGDAQTFTVNAHDPEGNPLSFDWYLDYAKIDECSSCSFLWTPERVDLGSHYLIARCSDGERFAKTYSRWYFTVVSTNVLQISDRLPHAIVGHPYESSVIVQGGTEPYSIASNVKREVCSFAKLGVLQDWTGDDKCWSVVLPFSFPFNGIMTNVIWVSDNGTICLDGSFSSPSYSDSAFENRAIIAPLWRDLNGNKQKIFLDDTVSNQFSIRWESISYGSSSTEPNVSFSATLCIDGTIRFSYGNSCLGGRVGISAGDGVHAILLPGLQNVMMSDANDIIMEPIAPGLKSTLNGEISGIPSEAGRYRFPVCVRDADDVSTNGIVELIVLPSENYSMTSPEPIPHEYIDTYCSDLLTLSGGNYEDVASAWAANGLNKIWECYVAGINPTNEMDRFKATISFDETGNPEVQWTPDLNEGGIKTMRKYRVLGRKQLSADELWVDVDTLLEADKKNYQFFKVTVEMP